ncbi:hypothetical protein LOAG_03968 [Loa loa]|uniref:Uncharacterized protein n=1 Tax=Loa loa TaxID=7209 RepID=A0A1S0U3E8_LOALO|nr:hypothetical protein LOAG_03968 [Loa loa]EFO24519.1 hypothetical protein LOAG_03968 [Loa loa]
MLTKKRPHLDSDTSRAWPLVNLLKGQRSLANKYIKTFNVEKLSNARPISANYNNHEERVFRQINRQTDRRTSPTPSIRHTKRLAYCTWSSSTQQHLIDRSY